MEKIINKIKFHVFDLGFYFILILNTWGISTIEFGKYHCLKTSKIKKIKSMEGNVHIINSLDLFYEKPIIVMGEHKIECFYHNPNFGLTTKARACKGVGQK
jgi:hypothetical protein